eukprot:PhF_6_TR5108/c0_g1_i3/m.7209
MMKAAFQQGAYGGSETLSVGDVARPTPKADEVLVKVIASSINPADYKFMDGWFQLLERSPQKLRIRGFDVCGVVVSVGAKAQRIKVGEKVIAMLKFTDIVAGNGAWAEYVQVKEVYCTQKPKDLSDQEAAGLPLVGLTSYHALTTFTHLPSGGKVVILAGSGGTGSVAIQIAKALGASVVATTCSGRNEGFVRSLGADVVVDYTKEMWWDKLAGQNYDVVYDCVGGYENWSNCHKVLKSGGKFVTIVGDQPRPLNISGLLSSGIAQANRKAWSFLGYPSYYQVAVFDNRYEPLEKVCAMVNEGRVRVPIDSKHPLTTEGVRAAVELMKSSRARGKIIIETSAAAEVSS